ncbi:MAG: hypothetical protein JST17_01395 [Bacteroidetes bacterium]|nr:hypothetical protein [Bacteroidota bacterium]MBS1931938.1 hypothetical protein [Bacteroidota bacterium]
MLNDESLVSSFERTVQNFQIFSQDLASASSVIGKIAETKGVTKELQQLFLYLNKLSLSYYEFRKEYLEIMKESVSDNSLKSAFESAIEDTEGGISDANAEINRFS